jgi:hypothetical protein
VKPQWQPLPRAGGAKQNEEPGLRSDDAGSGGGLGKMTRRKREIIGLTNERDFPHLVALTFPPGGFRSVFLEIDAFHRECPVALFPANSEREKISFNQVNKKTGNRIRYRKVDAETGDEVDLADIIKGYEVGKGQYTEIQPEELEAIAIESKRTIEIDEFVPKKEIDELYLNSPYYLVPDGEVGQQAFAVIREAIRKEGMVALGRVVFNWTTNFHRHRD